MLSFMLTQTWAIFLSLLVALTLLSILSPANSLLRWELNWAFMFLWEAGDIFSPGAIFFTEGSVTREQPAGKVKLSEGVPPSKLSAWTNIWMGHKLVCTHCHSRSIHVILDQHRLFTEKNCSRNHYQRDPLNLICNPTFLRFPCKCAVYEIPYTYGRSFFSSTKIMVMLFSEIFLFHFAEIFLFHFAVIDNQRHLIARLLALKSIPSHQLGQPYSHWAGY